MRPKEIKKLIELVEQSNINELEVSRWGKKVRILKSVNRPSTSTIHAETPLVSSPTRVPLAQEIILPPETATSPKVESSSTAAASDNIIEVKSPMVGTFYRAPAPDADPYVQVGDIVSPKQVLCIIEAMKLMNEIESEWRGKIKAILVDNAQPVEYNQVLFNIEKL